MTEEQSYIVWLSSIHQIGPKKYQDLMAYYGSAKEVFYQAKAETIQRWSGWGPKTAALVTGAQSKARLESVIKRLEQMDIALYFRGEEGYPVLLEEIYDPPPVLYARGARAPEMEQCIAMIGTRHCTRYGIRATKRLAADLAQSGCTIVSGMARGIDTAAHAGALEAGGFTIAVLGGGPDVVYPAENRKIYEQILQSGCVISEYYPGTPPSPGNFPARNRIISGLSLATIVVESREKGGSMITVRMAQEQGREVFAVPGNIDSPASKGTNQLICEGAMPVTCAEDVLFAMGWQTERYRQPQKSASFQAMDQMEQTVYDALSKGDLALDALCQLTGLAASQLSACLTLMEIRGIIKQLPGRVYTLEK